MHTSIAISCCRGFHAVGTAFLSLAINSTKIRSALLMYEGVGIVATISRCGHSGFAGSTLVLASDNSRCDDD